MNMTKSNARVKVLGQSYKTVASIDWTNVTPEQMQELAQRTVIHRYFSLVRVGDTPPDAETNITALDFVERARKARAPMTEEKAFALLQKSPEKLAALLRAAGLA